MKRFSVNAITALLALFAGSTSAAPYLYTFTGSINYIEIDGEYYSDVDFDNDYTTTADTFKVGDVVEYTFLVDFDLPGFCAGPLGTSYSSTCTGVDIPDSDTANYFFSDLVSATKLAPATEEDTTFNYGLSLTNLGWLVSDSAVFIVSPYDIPVEQWVASSETENGTFVVGTDAWATANGNSPYGRINSTLILTSIVPVVVEKPKDHCNRRKDSGNRENYSEKRSGISHQKIMSDDSHKTIVAERQGMKIYVDKESRKIWLEAYKREQRKNKFDDYNFKH